MAIVISCVTQNSIARQLQLQPGDKLLCVNGHAINDVLDYGFYTAAEQLALLVEHANGTRQHYTVEKGEYEELGIESESFLMDQQHSCQNNCIFCFIDQLPPGLRESLYFKDDDERLSFLFGNYITLTNLSDGDIARMIEMHISPINISVHTTDRALRCRMMGNRFAGDRLNYLYQLAEAGAELNCQIVLCRGINDGTALRQTLENLTALFPAVRSIACVPVGLTAHRNGLPELVPYDKASAQDVLSVIDVFHERSRQKNGVGLVYPADELFLLAGQDIPQLAYYDDLLQLENGVGMLAVLADEFTAALDGIEKTEEYIQHTIVTGELAAPILRKLVCAAQEKAPNLDCAVVAVKNEFFGEQITVAGLLTAHDIYNQLKNYAIKGDILITSNMLRSEGDLFLDNVSQHELSQKLGYTIIVNSDGAELAYHLLK